MRIFPVRPVFCLLDPNVWSFFPLSTHKITAENDVSLFLLSLVSLQDSERAGWHHSGPSAELQVSFRLRTNRNHLTSDTKHSRLHSQLSDPDELDRHHEAVTDSTSFPPAGGDISPNRVLIALLHFCLNARGDDPISVYCEQYEGWVLLPICYCLKTPCSVSS